MTTAKTLDTLTLIAVFSVLAATESWASPDLVVNEPTVISVATDIGDATINADLTVNNVKVKPDKDKTTLLPGSSGLTPQILVTGASGVYNEGAANTHTMKIGANGGMGCLVVSNSANVRIQQFRVEAGASDPSTPGTNTVLRLEDSGMAVIDNGYNYNLDAVARVVFAGGRMRGANPFRTEANTRWLVQAEPGHDIRFVDLALQGNNILTGQGQIELATDGDIVVGDDGQSSSSPTTQGKLLLTGSTNQVIYSHAGDIVLSNNVQLIMKANDCLPCGPSNGGIRITKTISDDKYFTNGRKMLPNFMTEGYSSRCNWIDVQDGFMTNASSTASTIKLGTRDEATSFRGHAFGNIVIEKSGTNRLALADALLPRLDVNDGPVLVTAGKTNAISRVEDARLAYSPELTVGGGAALNVNRLGSSRIDNVDIAPDGVLSVGEGSLSVTNLTGGGTLAKSGDSSFVLRTYEQSPAPDLKVRVAGGTFKFAGMTFTNHWWRFTFKKAKQDSYVVTRPSDGASANMTFSIGKIHLHNALPNTRLDKDSDVVNINLTEDPTYDGSEEDLSGLQPGTITSRNDYLASSGSDDFAGGAVWEGTGSLVKGMGNWPHCMICTNNVLDPLAPETWVTVAFRLSANSAPVNGYSLAVSANSRSHEVAPTDWIVETSPSGKPGTWTVVDEQADVTPGASKYSNVNQLYPRYNDSRAYGMNSSLANLDLGDVQVGGGGLLDVSLVDGPVSVSTLTIDYQSPAGTISKCDFAESGEVRIVNVPDGTRIISGSAFPLVVQEPLGIRNFKRWKVYVDGVEKPQLHPRLTADKLMLDGLGMMIIFK
jgi:hypothetical protein